MLRDQGTRLLIKAASRNDVLLVTHMLERGAHVDARDMSRPRTFGYTALHYAAAHNNRVMAQALLDKNASVEMMSCHGTALRLALLRGSYRVVEAIVDSVRKHDMDAGRMLIEPPLEQIGTLEQWMLYRDDLDVFFILYGRQPSSPHNDFLREAMARHFSLIDRATSIGSERVFRECLRRLDDIVDDVEDVCSRELLNAVRSNCLFAVRPLLEQGAHTAMIDADHNNLFHLCATNDSIEMFALLVESMDQDEVDELLTHNNLQGQTPPAKAIYFGKERCSQAMIEHVLLMELGDPTDRDVFRATSAYIQCVQAAFDTNGVSSFGQMVARVRAQAALLETRTVQEVMANEIESNPFWVNPQDVWNEFVGQTFGKIVTFAMLRREHLLAVV